MAISELFVSQNATQVPITLIGSTIINNTNQVVTIGNDFQLQSNTLTLNGGSSLELPPPGPYWIQSQSPCMLQVMPGKVQYFTAASNVANDVTVVNSSPIEVAVTNTVPFNVLQQSTYKAISVADSLAPIDTTSQSNGVFVAGFTPVITNLSGSIILRSYNFAQQGSAVVYVGLAFTANTSGIFKFGNAANNRPWDRGDYLMLPGSNLYLYCSGSIEGFLTLGYTTL